VIAATDAVNIHRLIVREVDAISYGAAPSILQVSTKDEQSML